MVPISSHSSHLVCVAAIVAAHGIKGEVKVRTFTEDPESIEDYPLLNQSGNKEFKITIRQVIGDDMVIAHVEGINNRNDAEKLRQTQLYIERSRLPKPKKDEFYLADLIGLMVHNDKGDTIGSVVAMHNFGAGDIIEIAFNDQEQTSLFPFTCAIVPTVNLAKNFIVIHPPKTHELDNE